MAELHFDFRDVFRAGRYGFSSKKISIHFLGLALGYLIYEILVYASLLIAGGSAAADFWRTYALLPVCPFVDYDFEPITIGAMGIGTFAFFIIFFWASTMVSKVTIQQLRGDSFFSIGDSLSFTKQNWKAVFGTFVSLVVIFVLLAMVSIAIGLLGKIPAVGRIVVMLASVLTPIAFFLGLLMAYLLVILGVGLLFVPAVVATADSDAFETIYQHFTTVWNQPWRLVVYETLLFGVKLICTPIWAMFCLTGFALALLPVRLLIPMDVKSFMGYANEWLGGGIAKLTTVGYVKSLLVFDTTAPSTISVTGFNLLLIQVTSIFITVSLLFIVGLIVAYLLSIASVGNTLIYTILRRRIDEQNLLEVKDEEADTLQSANPEPDASQPENSSSPEEKSE